MNEHPRIDNAPGLDWRRRLTGEWVAVWIARKDLRRDGYRPKTVQLWHGLEPGKDDVINMQAECQRLQDDMLAWANSRGETAVDSWYDGTLRGLINAYRRDADSPYNKKLRFRSRGIYDAHLNFIERAVGARALAALKWRDFINWYDIWSAPESEGDSRHTPRAHARMTMLRILFGFGVASEHDLDNCVRLSVVLSKMEFDRGKPRDAELTADHVIAIRKRAHDIGRPSVALAEALKFELALRPKDVIGELIPLDWPGTSATIVRGRKWVMGLDWREISEDLILTHRLSKSIKGKNALTDPKAGKTKIYDLKLYPMIMQELLRLSLPMPSGPVIISESTGQPYMREAYRKLWRSIADQCGVPANVQCRDSRAGAITEGIDASGGDVEANRHAAGHSKLETTLRYSRAGDRQTAKVAVLRAKNRKG